MRFEVIVFDKERVLKTVMLKLTFLRNTPVYVDAYDRFGTHHIDVSFEALGLFRSEFPSRLHQFDVYKSCSIDSDICQPISIILLAMTFCLDAKINQMNLTNPFS